jgi:hypothetical protein
MNLKSCIPYFLKDEYDCEKLRLQVKERITTRRLKIDSSLALLMSQARD